LESVTSLKLWSDHELILTALRSPDALQLGRCKAYGEDFNEVAEGRIVGIPVEYLGPNDVCDTLGSVPPDFLEDREVVMAAVAKNGAILEFLGDDFKADIDIAHAAVLQSGSKALVHVSSGIREDPVIRKALEQHQESEVWRSVSPEGSLRKIARVTTKIGRSSPLLA